ncbi:MAG TPA: plastocyanin/azurin family copper-binding protein [Polyangia bacterium]|jgi:plastocyanin|nr:plastocyanin/azurin family copper-binding protein [Polyangia bacterium]
MSLRILSKLALPVLPVLIVTGLLLSRVSAGEKHVVSQKGKSFSITELKVKVGDTVEFKNDDDVSHNVFSVSKSQPFNTKMQTPGADTAVTFTTEGTVEVRCAIHPGMKLTVQVGK